MTNNASGDPAGRKRQWFARRQVYLRTGQDSQYVELSPFLQIGTAIGFGALALWLIGATYGAVAGLVDTKDDPDLLAELSNTRQALDEVERERDNALSNVVRIGELENALAAAEQAILEAESTDETVALRAELEQTRSQLDELHLRLSESKADHAALQARFEAEASGNADAAERTAEEASSLHSQLEEAFAEIETLEQQRDEASAELAGLRERNLASTEAIERNDALLKAAKAEIERLQETIVSARAEAESAAQGQLTTIARLEQEFGEAMASKMSLEGEVENLGAALERAEAAAAQSAEAGAAVEAHEATIAKLEQELGEVVTVKMDLERQVEDLGTALEEAKTAALASAEASAAADAAAHASSIEAGLKESDLLATIEGLSAELALAGEAADQVRSDEDDDEMRSLRQRAAIAESEIERLIFSRLTEEKSPGSRSIDSALPPRPASDDPAETKRLKSELMAARADIIKLNADVKAARQRLAEQTESSDGQTTRPDNSAKLEQQLASTRSRVQQLNKALADAKLREVAIDLALISVLPTPSPPAPR